ncbi:MAG TPA: HTTM domain-containing protein [Candidatus Elarobacter sp.]|nr:HTTM domain-containing protein [Candidatus Elarobacter sp.]
MQYFSLPYAAWTRWLQRDRWLIGAAIVRISFGFVVFSMFVTHVRDREFLFGPNGLLPYPEFQKIIAHLHEFNVYGFSSSDAYFNAVFFGSMAVSLMFMLGYKTRFIAPVFAVLTWSTYHRMPYMMDGGYRLMTILLFYVAFADLGRRLSVDEYLVERSGARRQPYWLANMCHNGAVIACMMQVCVVYMFSTFYKITGETWQHGTAIYYALSLEQFNMGALTNVVRDNPYLVILMTYLTLLYQSSFPWLVWHPRLKYAVLGLAVLFHGGIAVSMGLYWFSAIMIACEAFFISDRAYEVFFAALSRMWARFGPRKTAVERYVTS